MQALRLYTAGSSWFSGEEQEKGAIAPGRLADLAVLSADYFSIPEEEIPRIEAVLTMVGGKVVHGSGSFAPLAPPAPPSAVSWSPERWYGGYGAPRRASSRGALSAPLAAARLHRSAPRASALWGPAGCDC
jgi:hypothetical protein